jgi:hypothetical protein
MASEFSEEVLKDAPVNFDDAPFRRPVDAALIERAPAPMR